MTALPSVEPLPPGARPTERGWYVMLSGSQNTIVEFDPEPRPPIYWLSGIEGSFYLKEADTFIARIYPDRIGQE